MKKNFYLILVLCLLWGGNAYGIEIIESDENHIYFYLPKGTSSQIIDGPDKVRLHSNHCNNFKKNTYAFSSSNEYGTSIDGTRFLFGRMQIRLICGKNKQEAVGNITKLINRNRQTGKTLTRYGSQMTMSGMGRFPSINHIVYEAKSRDLITEEQNELKRKLENDKLVRIKKAEEEKKKLEIKKTKEEEAKRQLVSSLEKKYADDCTGGLFSKKFIKGTKEYKDCLLEQEAKQIAEEDKFNKILANMNPEERRAYVCEETYGFRKGSDKFSECVYKILTADVELEKIELQKKLAEAQLETARANEAAAKANESAARAKENTGTESSKKYAPGYDPNVAAAMNRANELEKAKILLNLGRALGTPLAGPKFNAPQKQLNCRVNPYNNKITCY